MGKPELLSPAGGWTAMTAAVQNGADAVYLGVGRFNARQPAENFTFETLKEAVRYCTLRGAKVYVTLNTLVRQDEWASLEETADAIAASGAQGVLVQDLGIARWLKRRYPSLPLHASTQMAAHNLEGVRFLADQGFARVVLAREMPLSEIRRAAGLGVEIEVFAHGALCVSGSGQCLFSSMVGGRSANRGRCAQPCRLEYRLEGACGHLLSCRDLCAIELLPKLSEAGVASLKLEGRLKRPEYVAVVTRAYRNALDHPGEPVDLEALRQMFNRGGFSEGYLTGMEERTLIGPERPNHAGVEVGRCTRPGKLRLSEEVCLQDALVLRRRDGDAPLTLSGAAGEEVRCPEARMGDVLIRLVSKVQMDQALQSFARETRTTPLRARLTLRTGEPARLVLGDGTREVAAEGAPVQAAERSGLDPERCAQQIGKTGGTPWRFSEILTDVDARAWLPMSGLNALRREAIAAWEAAVSPAPWPKAPAAEEALPQGAPLPEAPELWVESGDPAVLAEALRQGAEGALYAPADLRPEGLAKAEAELPERFELSLPWMLPGEALPALNRWAARLGERISGVWINNVGGLGLPWPGTRFAGPGLNLMNLQALKQAREWGCEGYEPSLELTGRQISLLPPPEQLFLYGRAPLMQLAHCPYRTAWGLAGRHADCRRCDSHPETAPLIDRRNAAFPLRRMATEGGCVLTLLNSVPLMPLRQLSRIPKTRRWRLNIDDAARVEPLLRLYRRAARGEDLTRDAFWETLNGEPSTTGHYVHGVE